MKWNLKYYFEKMDAASSEVKKRGSLLLALSSKAYIFVDMEVH